MRRALNAVRPTVRGEIEMKRVVGRLGASWGADLACPEGIEPPTTCLEATRLPLQINDLTYFLPPSIQSWAFFRSASAYPMDPFASLSCAPANF